MGSGLIGAGWAIQFLYHGQKHICLYDPVPESLTRARERIEEVLQWLVDNGAMTAERLAGREPATAEEARAILGITRHALAEYKG